MTPARGALPRAIVVLVRALLPATTAEPVLGDIEEDLRRERARRSAFGATCRLAGQTVWLIGGYWKERWRARALSGRPGRLAGGRLRRPHRRGVLPAITVDVRLALRRLRRSPGFAAAVVGILALGIGLEGMAFSAVHAILLDPMPGTDRDRFVMVDTYAPDQDLWLATDAAVEMVSEWPEALRTLERVEAYETAELTWLGPDEPTALVGAWVTPGLLDGLGVTPLLGRRFGPPDGTADAGPVAILSEGFWRRSFGESGEVLGRTLRLDGAPSPGPEGSGAAATVVGVIPRVPGLPAHDVWLPHTMDRDRDLVGSAQVVAWLAPGVTLEEAQAEVEGVSAGESSNGWRTHARLTRPGDRVGEGTRRALAFFLGAVTLVLLVACANVANLMVARGTRRRRAIALRAALGASRGRIVRELVVESLVLASLASVVGVVLAARAPDLLALLVPGRLGLVIPHGIRMQGVVVAWTVAMALATALLSGLWPAVRVSRAAPGPWLGGGGPGTAGRRGERWSRGVLVGSQVALSLVLLCAAGLLVASAARLVRIEPGFDAGRVLAMNVAPPDDRDAEARRALFAERLLERLRTLDGVEAATLASAAPPFSVSPRSVEIEDRPGVEIQATLLQASVDPAFFRTLGIPIVRGQVFTTPDSPEVLVNRGFAARAWPGRDPIGKRFRTGGDRWYRVVGIVGDISQAGVPSIGGAGSGAPRLADLQVYHRLGSPRRPPTFLIRTETGVDPGALAGPLEEQVWALEPTLPIARLDLLDDRLASSPHVVSQRAAAVLLGLCAAVALALATAGVAAVVSCAVSERTREIGIRMALGARARTVRSMVVWEGMRPVLGGLAVGLLGGAGAGRLLQGLLYEVGATHPPTFVTTTLLLSGIGLLAAWIPARRATRVDPADTLRR